MIVDSKNSKNALVNGVPFGAVSFIGGLMKEVTDRVMKATVPNLKRMFDDKDISHAVENFKICAGEAEGAFDGSVFCDGDFYKWLESAVYTAYTLNDEELKAQIEEYIGLIARSQQEDGYISTKQIIGERDGSAQRNSDINDFEVYNMGHLFTSACVHYRVSGRDGFLIVAKKAAGYLEKLYEEAERSGEVRTAVCPSHYMGLFELYRTTGDEKYLRLGKKAIELRDSVRDGLDDNQDRLSLKKHDKIIGHSVRANYLYAGLADLCAEESDPEYERVLRSVWTNLVTKKLYITGGCGALYNGASPYGNFFDHQLIHQAYGYEYQLPNITAYNETCASIGLVMWAYRMFRLNAGAEYFDMIERVWLNVNLASVSLDGLRYFYENMLRRTKKLDYELIWPLTRTDYLISYCCPPNIARMLSQAAEYVYFVKKDGSGIMTGLYGDSEAEIPLQGSRVHILQKTRYPYEGRIIFNIETEKDFTLSLRIPAWCKSGKLLVYGQEQRLNRAQSGTYAQSLIKAGKSELVLELDMPVVLMRSNPMIEENTGQLAVTKGPLVYCAEFCDISELADSENGEPSGSGDADLSTLDGVFIPADCEFSEEELRIDTEGYMRKPRAALNTQADREGDEKAANEAFGTSAQVTVPALRTTGIRIKDRTENGIQALDRPLYAAYEAENTERKEVSVRFIPYFAWDNRGFGEMKIWMPAIW